MSGVNVLNLNILLIIIIGAVNKPRFPEKEQL